MRFHLMKVNRSSLTKYHDNRNNEGQRDTYRCGCAPKMGATHMEATGTRAASEEISIPFTRLWQHTILSSILALLALAHFVLTVIWQLPEPR
jgi:hypothetical protein